MTMSASDTPGEIKALVLRLRKALGMQDVRRLDLHLVLEKMRRLFPDFDYQIVEGGELGLREGFYDSATSKIALPEQVFSGLATVPRSRFTVAHEIGHWMLRHEGQRNRQAERKAYERAVPQIRRDERHADEFATQLLAPDHLVETCSSVAEIERDFGLSRQAAEIRKKEVDALVRQRTGQPRELPGSVVDFLEHARAKGYNITSLPPAPRKLAQASELAEKPPVSAAPPHYIQERCPNCGEQKLVLLGSKCRCDNCKKVSDGFQDGDIVA